MKKFVSSITIFLIMTPAAFAEHEEMPSMPRLQPQKIFIVKDGLELESQRGFGAQEPMVRMMNLMMVEGSGMEGMDMGSMIKSKPLLP